MDELYDLRDDPAELANLIGRPDLVELQAELSTGLRRWLVAMEDPLVAAAADLPPAGTIVATGAAGP